MNQSHCAQPSSCRFFPFFSARFILQGNGKRGPEHSFGTRDFSETLGLFHFLAVELLKLEDINHYQYPCQKTTQNLSQLPVYRKSRDSGTCYIEQGDVSAKFECGNSRNKNWFLQQISFKNKKGEGRGASQ